MDLLSRLVPVRPRPWHCLRALGGTVALSHRVRPAQQIFLSAPRDMSQTAPSGPAQVVTKETPCGG